MNILTFDIEEWFHCDFISGDKNWLNYEERIKRNTDFILDLLSKNNLKASFFILGWVAIKYPGLVKKIFEAGHEIGCHSMNHQLVHRFSPKQYKEDTKNALAAIEQVIGEKIIMYRAPAFSITKETPWAFEILNELGITHDSSVFPAKHDYGGFRSFENSEPTIIESNGHLIKEFPINVRRTFGKAYVFSGGGFFRLFPYRLIKKWATDADYVMTYFHPRDFDAGQPMLPHLPLIRKFKSYYGLTNCGPKLDRYLSDFETTSLLEGSKKFDWNRAKTFVI